ncbi:STAS domain-containing protein [Haliovirga abyssi]|uniref:Anti-sigma factor antagonist n=1 Tax=Haliovirga abyssi TaxID=2996794 RepID=A0AAU9D2D2_9FUSO|nr:STAS domain-containing protein [Haliovirga abyssi]BDU50149.1 hypothetical protein HLVA_07180 [Haliovirga abyssi]
MLEKEIVNNRVIVSIDMDFTIQEARELKREMKIWEAEDIINVVLDMSRVKYIDSSAIGVLVTLLKYTKKQNGSLKLYSVGDDVMRILKLVNLVSFFDITDKLE